VIVIVSGFWVDPLDQFTNLYFASGVAVTETDLPSAYSPPVVFTVPPVLAFTERK